MQGRQRFISPAGEQKFEHLDFLGDTGCREIFMYICCYAYLLYHQARKHLHHTQNDAIWSRFTPHRPTGENIHASCCYWGQHVSETNITAQDVAFCAACTNYWLSFQELQCTICGRQECFASRTQTCTRWRLFTWLRPPATSTWFSICSKTRYDFFCFFLLAVEQQRGVRNVKLHQNTLCLSQIKML